VRADRILQVDEDSGGMDGTGVPRHRVVDLSLQRVVALPPIAARTIAAAEGSVVVIGSDGLVVLDAETQPVRTLEESWPIGASGALPLRPIVADPDAQIAAFESPRQVAEAATSRPALTTNRATTPVGATWWMPPSASQ